MNSWFDLFQLAAKSAPSRDLFISGLIAEARPTDDDDVIARALTRHIEEYVQQSDRILQIINNFYTQHRLHVTPVDTW